MPSQLFGVPVAAVSLTDRDRQWFKSRVGVDHASISRDGAPCSHVAVTTAPLVIEDLRADPRYAESSLARAASTLVRRLSRAPGSGLAHCACSTPRRAR